MSQSTSFPPTSQTPVGKRANRLPMYFVVLLLSIFIVAMLFAMQTRVKKEPIDDGGVEEANVSGVGLGIELIKGRGDGVVGARGEIDPVNESEENFQKRMQSELDQQRLQKMREEWQRTKDQMDFQVSFTRDAITGPIDVDLGSLTSGNSGGGGNGSVSANRAAMAAEASGGRQASSSGMDADLAKMIAASSSSTDRRFISSEEIQTPSSDFEIKTGTIMPSVLITEINSDLPGEVVGQIRSNIYDSRTGRHLLIPQGTKLYGVYDSGTVLGQNRLVVRWDRIIFPDTQTLSINGMNTVDGRGLSGANDRVNTHFFKTLANALLLSTVSASMNRYGDSDSTDSSLLEEIGVSTGDTMEGVISSYIEQQLKIKPTIEIRAGYMFNIMVNRDLVFAEPYKYGYSKRIESVN